MAGKWQTTASIFSAGEESHGEHYVVLLLYPKSGDWMAQPLISYTLRLKTAKKSSHEESRFLLLNCWENNPNIFDPPCTLTLPWWNQGIILLGVHMGPLILNRIAMALQNWIPTEWVFRHGFRAVTKALSHSRRHMLDLHLLGWVLPSA